jgi:EAL domain-containing protein (putative c-di-GMP-specific phosphodiesterase class I)
LHVAVNLSTRQLVGANFVATLEEALAHGRLPAGSLWLEITESVLMEATTSTWGILDRLKDAGPQLGIDDFGTGYSSLTYLRRFPVDFVKIDRSFVNGLGADSEDTAIVTAVVQLGKALGLRTVAEGVETAEQLAILRELDCDLAQGYYFARPQPAEAVTDLLVSQQHW